MKRYIDSEALKEKKVYSAERHENVVPVAEIDWLSTADVVEVRHGRWIKHKENCLEYRCVVCEYELCRETNYCPNCGAKMEGGDTDDNI